MTDAGTERAPPRCAAEPCVSCPYRTDVPSGIWAPSEYRKLEGYDAETWAQPMALFRCHSDPSHLCAGWVACHGTDDLLALRCNDVDGSVWGHAVRTPVFATGRAAMEHGLARVSTPDDDASRMIEKIMKNRRSGHEIEGGGAKET